MMTAEELKASILQMAMQGKLVEQRPEEGTGEELYQEIQEKKHRLIKEGKRKKEKNLSPISDDEIKVEFPNSWKLVRLGNVISLLSGADLTPDKYNSNEKGTVYITGASSIENGNVIINRWTENPKNIAHKGDLLLTCKGTVGKTAILNLKEAHIARQIMAITPILLDVRYIDFFLQYIIESLKKKAKSMIPGIDRDVILNTIFPLPPLAEQKRIVAKIEEVMPFVDQYATSSEKLNVLNTTFPDQMKKSIVQQAVQGKLVPQDPNDEPASVLLEKIAEEKQKLIKEGKIKKQKSLPAITEDEIPFEIPESWEWARLADVTKSITDGDHQAPPQTQDGIPFLVISNVSSGHVDFSNTRFVSKEYYENLSEDRKAEQGDVIFTVTGSYGIPLKVETDRKFCFQRHIALLKPMINSDFLVLLLSSHLVQDQCDRVATGTAQKTVGLISLRNIKIPIPPVEEQERIIKILGTVIPEVGMIMK